MSATTPQLFPRSAYKLSTLQDLLDKVPWKETGSSRKFIVCFNEYREQEMEGENTPTPTSVATPSSRKAKARSAAASSRQKPIKIKEEPISIAIKKETKKEGMPKHKTKDSVSNGPTEEIDLTLGDLDISPLRETPPISRKRTLSHVADPQSSRTTPTRASIDDIEIGTASTTSDGFADLTPDKDSLPRYPRRINRQLKKEFRGFEDIC